MTYANITICDLLDTYMYAERPDNAAYINAYIERQRKMCMEYLTSDTTRQAALDVLLVMLKSK